ncbi:MAG: hypothetical protein JNL98_31500 [Bryobacterales bacterium]|nr:hypothetical protein [Bryobacterales bacterium]
MRVLIVMTNPARRATESALAQLGVEAVSAANAGEAAHALDVAPDALVTQVALADGNWRDVIDAVFGRWGPMPVAVCSSIAGAERDVLAEDVRRSGGFALFDMPAAMEQLRDLLGSAEH